MLAKKHSFINWGIAAIVSILIGIVTMLLMGGSLKVPFEVYAWNAGYSLSLGLPLFANGPLFNWFEKRFIDWIKFPVKSVFRALLMHLVYSSTVILTVNWFWYIHMQQREWDNFWAYNKGTIFAEYIIFVIIAAILYAISFFKAWRQEVCDSEKIKTEALSLKYQVLQNQVNPHFLFNSLNVLDSLLDTDVAKAKEFTLELSHFFRTVLYLKDKDLIPLKEEIDFVKKYIYLQQIRFGKALEVEIVVRKNMTGNVIPLSLQALVENAIKHNEISRASPLKIMIAVTDNHTLMVENNIQPRNATEPGNKTGLKNLAGRYEYLTGKKVEIIQHSTYFRVILPLIQLD
jgi:two-component system, LytTR family, sensor kinase